jgi:hypothetical protein
VKQGRLIFLLVAAAGLAAVRWWLPPPAEGDVPESPDVVAAVERPLTERASTERTVSEAMSSSTTTSGVDLPGNAFSVRVAVMPPAPPPPPAPPKEKPFVGPPAPPPYVPPPPPPPPPVQVVGTWDDGQSPGVFISSPQGGTVLARVGTVLLADYKVTGLTPQHVALTHTSSKHEWRLPIPRAGSHP